MRWPSQLQAQLVSAANGADRANRPAIFIALPGLAVVIALVAMLVILARFGDARRTLQARQRDAQNLSILLTNAKSHRSESPDLAGNFPVVGFFDDSVDKIARSIWPDPPGGKGVITVPPRRDSNFFDTKIDLIKADVTCTPPPAGVELDKLTEFIQTVLNSPELRGVFVAKLELRPAPNGWTGSVVFRRYEYKPPRR